MKRVIICAGFLLGLTPFVFAQSDATNSTTTTTSTTTTQDDQSATASQSSANVRRAQQQLNKQGYDVGSVDGVMGPKTRSALEKFQSDKGLTQTGRLDATTMKELGSGRASASKTPPPVSKAATALGSDTKEAGHDIKTGHPVEAGKTVGSGAVDMGKSVGHETKSVAKKADKKVKKGMDVLSKKIYGTTGDEPEAKTPDQTKSQDGAVAQPQSPNTPK